MWLFLVRLDILEMEVTTATRVAGFMFENGLATVELPRDIRSWIERATLYTGLLIPARVLCRHGLLRRSVSRFVNTSSQRVHRDQSIISCERQLPPMLRDVAVGIDAIGERSETDSMGAIDVPADRYWGAQTQRSLIHFSIGDDHMPKAVYPAMVM